MSSQSIIGYSDIFAIGTPTYEYPNIAGYSGVFEMNMMGEYISGYSGWFALNTEWMPVTAGFNANLKNPGVNQAVQFTDQSTGTILPNVWVWDFGDGTPVSNLKNPVHTYSSAGKYKVKLTVTNSIGAYSVKEIPDYITVNSGNYGIALKIVETGTQGVVKWVGYQYRNGLGILCTENNFPVQNQEALISWGSKLPWQNDFNDEIILYGETNGAKKQIGHIYFEYEHSVEKEFIRNAIIIFHNTGMSESFPYGPGMHDYDYRWDYYKNGEFPVSMLIPPNNIFQETYSKKPLLLIHGWEGTFSLEKNPDAKADQNETSYWFTTVSILNKESSQFDTWQYYYPYNSAHNHLAICLKDALENLKTYYTSKKIRLVTHSMGGLVTLNYATMFPDDAILKVEKVLFLAPPGHGSLGANLYYKTIGSIGLQRAIDYDRHAPSVRDMKLGRLGDSNHTISRPRWCQWCCR